MIILTQVGTDKKAHKGTWRRIKFDGQWTAKVYCPGCKFQASLAGSHEILDDGRVAPSLDCPKCKFHDHVTLDGWIPILEVSRDTALIG